MRANARKLPDGSWWAMVPGFPELAEGAPTEEEAVARAEIRVRNWRMYTDGDRAIPEVTLSEVERQQKAHARLVSGIPHLVAAARPNASEGPTRYGAADRPDTPERQRRALERVAATRRLLRIYRALHRLGERYPNRRGLGVPAELSEFVDDLGRGIFRRGDPADNLASLLGPGKQGAKPISGARRAHGIAVEVAAERRRGLKKDEAVDAVQKRHRHSVRNIYDARRREANFEASGGLDSTPDEI